MLAPSFDMRFSALAWFVSVAVVSVVLAVDRASAEEPLFLVRDGQSQCTIVRGRDDDFAAERLQRYLTEKGGVAVDIVTADRWERPEKSGFVVLGSAASNPWVAKIAKEQGIDVAAARLTDQGYVAQRVSWLGKEGLLLAGGGRDGALYAVVDLTRDKLESSDRSVWVGSLGLRQIPRLRYRWFWDWDCRMDWGAPGKANSTCGGPYEKPASSFLEDGKRCVDFMADHKFNGLILWGFLRDSHGGVAAGQELCRYARRRSVRILPGVGTNDSYGGYYYQGKHPFNMATWLAEHPEVRARDKAGKTLGSACPSNPVHLEWLDRGAKWFFDTFEVGGANLEMGDLFVCYCDTCQKTRQAIPSREPDYYKDMAISHRVTLRTMRQLAPEAWLSYATYTGYTPEMLRDRPQFLSLIPEDAICQWTLTGMASKWPGTPGPAKHNLGYLHWCSAFTCCKNQDDFYLEEIRNICRDAAASSFEGLDTYGELSPERPNVEIFYLAWEAFLWNPEMTVEQFVDQRLGPLYGGSQAARALLEIMPLVKTDKQRQNPQNCSAARRLAESARTAASPEGRPRWDRLLASLEHHQRVAEDRIEESRRQEAAARSGQKVPVASVKASDEDISGSHPASKAIDESVAEPAGYWLTKRNHPRQAWIELTLAQPTKVNRVSLFHQIDAGHYRSLDYRICVRRDGAWAPVATVRNNERAGWTSHQFPPVVTDAVRLEITRSAHGDRMGVGEIEVRNDQTP